MMTGEFDRDAGDRITPRNAVIRTATITVSTLTLNSKQLTLSVFRQLIEEPIFDWRELALRGIGWGHVRYLIDWAPSQAIHLVWQRGDVLRRCVVKRNPPPAPSAEIRASLTQRPYQPWGERNPMVSRELRDCGDTWRGCRPSCPETLEPPPPERQPPREQLAAYCAWAKADDQRWANFKDEIERHENEARQQWPLVFARIDRACGAYRELVAPLFELPQLFIAV
jgi:hypothetical protein